MSFTMLRIAILSMLHRLIESKFLLLLLEKVVFYVCGGGGGGGGVCWWGSKNE